MAHAFPNHCICKPCSYKSFIKYPLQFEKQVFSVRGKQNTTLFGTSLGGWVMLNINARHLV